MTHAATTCCACPTPADLVAGPTHAAGLRLTDSAGGVGEHGNGLCDLWEFTSTTTTDGSCRLFAIRKFDGVPTVGYLLGDRRGKNAACSLSLGARHQRISRIWRRSVFGCGWTVINVAVEGLIHAAGGRSNGPLAFTTRLTLVPRERTRSCWRPMARSSLSWRHRANFTEPPSSQRNVESTS